MAEEVRLTRAGLLRPDRSAVVLEPSASSATLYFAVEDITASFEELRRRGMSSSTPRSSSTATTRALRSPGDEEWMAFFRDPDGNLLAIMSRRSG